MLRSHSLALIFSSVLLAPAFAGCLELPLDDPLTPFAGGKGGATFDTSRGWSMPLSPELYALLEPVKALVASFDGTPIALGIFFPDVAGCETSVAEGAALGASAPLADACRFPVVMDAGPYYADHVDQDKFRPPLVEWLVTRGYVVVQMSIRGTGESGGCMELFSTNEQKDVDAMITWLATQPWSNGNVGMMGRSYDGTTPLMGAALANPALKTIVPISSVPSLADLMFKNGTSEVRGPIFHSVVYWGFYGVGAGDGGAPLYRRDHLAEQQCEAFVTGTEKGPETALTGDASHAYWTERDFRDRIISDYKGSIWIVHGLEDWNVNPSQVVPWINELQDAGIETRAWLGVWAHAYPDRVDEHRNVRWDWAEETVKWFDYYLKNEGAAPPLNVEVEDNLFVWRAEESYPPRDATFVEFEPSTGGALVDQGKASTGHTFVTPQVAGATFTSEPFADAIRVAGLPQFHGEFTPSTVAGGSVFAELNDIFPDGRSVRIGWSMMNLRYHAGGNTAPAMLIPGVPVKALMEFEPLDAIIAKGHRLQLVIHRDGVEDVLPSASPEPMGFDYGNSLSLLRLPVIERPNVVPSYAAPGLGTAAS